MKRILNGGGAVAVWQRRMQLVLAGTVLWLGMMRGGAQTGMPVYQVTQAGASLSQARSLAGGLNIPFESLSVSNGEVFYLDSAQFMAVPTSPISDPVILSNLTFISRNDFPQVPLEFARIDLAALGKLTVVSSNEALNSVNAVFDKSSLLPQFGSPGISHTLLQAYYSNENNVVISNGAFLDTQVKYHFLTPGSVAPGPPIIGPGAQVQIAFGTNGAVARLHYAARRYSQGPTIAIFPPSQASNRVARLFPGMNVHLSPQLVYYAPPLSLGTVSNLIPWYACTGTGTITNPLTGGLSTFNLNAPLVPATDDPAYVPSVVLTANVLGGTQVVATAEASGGMGPYTYLWGGSSPTISSNTGNQISYTLTARIQPPSLEAMRLSPGILQVSWIDPTGGFLLESSSSLVQPVWGSVNAAIQQDNGVNRVQLQLDVAQPMFFRLRYNGQSIPESVMVTVTDANGVEAQASQTLQVKPMLRRPLATAQSRAVPRVIGTVDWGTESPFDPGLGSNDRAGWVSAMTLFGGGVQRFQWTGNLSWRWDFIDPPTGIDSSEVDNADITLYIGHGNPEVITFTGTPNLYYPDAPKSWGDRDDEWLCFLSCDVLEFSDSAGNVWSRWGPNFNGLHILTGFSSLAYAGTGFPAGFALNMLGFFTIPSQSIVNAWFSSANAHGTGTPAAMGPIGPGGSWDYYDYYWGRGSVGPTIPASQIRGWWYLN